MGADNEAAEFDKTMAFAPANCLVFQHLYDAVHKERNIIPFVGVGISYFAYPISWKALLEGFLGAMDPVHRREILENAVKTIPVSPKCGMRLADMLFEGGEYEKALEVLNKSIYGSIQAQDSVNQAYLYYLSGLCKIIICMKAGRHFEKSDVIDIFQDFGIAQNSGLQLLSYSKVMQRQITMLELRTGLKYTDFVDPDSLSFDVM